MLLEIWNAMKSISAFLQDFLLLESKQNVAFFDQLSLSCFITPNLYRETLKTCTHLGEGERVAGDVSFLYQVGDCFSARNMLLWPRKWQICDAELGRLKNNCI